MHFPQLLVLAASTLSLVHLAAATSPYPESIRSTRMSIFADAERQLSQLDATKPAVFAYRTRTPREEWGYCFFERGRVSSVAERAFYLIAPPRSTAYVLPLAFWNFVPLTDSYLVFVRQVPDSAGLDLIAKELWSRRSAGNSELWFTEFRDEMVRRFGEVE